MADDRSPNPQAPAEPTDNALLGVWSTPFGIAPFADIAPADFGPAFDAALAADSAEIEAIASSTESPTFANTIEAFENSGRMLDCVASVFYNLTGAHSNDTLRAIEREVAPRLAAHRTRIHLDDRLHGRVKALVGAGASLGLDAEQARVLERYRRMFERAGAGKPGDVKARLATIAERLAVLGTRFGQNVLADEQAYALPLGEGDLGGLSPALIATAREAGAERGLDGPAITLSRSLIEPFLAQSDRRDLRETAFRAWIARGSNGGATDNREIIAETVALRAEKARLLGFASFAHYRLDDSMAATPDAVSGLLRSVWEPARRLASREAADLQTAIDREGGGFALAPHDWRYYTGKVRHERFALDAAELKPYLPLEGMIQAAFDTASRLFGLSFTERRDVPVYHPDVRVWEVTGRDGEPVGLFLGDYFARSSKRSGAWMSSFRGQRKLGGAERPIIVNVMNFAKGSQDPGADRIPALLEFDDARTLFHEFGHALHGLLSDVTYPTLAGTGVVRDFVEFPSQLFEHWLEEPAVLGRFARHYRTGEPMPAALLGRMLEARRFNQGFATVEYTASALVDLDFHLLADEDLRDNLDVDAFERASLAEIGMPEAIVMRHRSAHFAHVFAGDGYSAAYYSYLWSEVLDADGYGAFTEAGDPFDPATAERLRRFVYAAGDSRPPDEAYRAFRGRDPRPEALLKQRGLAVSAAA